MKRIETIRTIVGGITFLVILCAVAYSVFVSHLAMSLAMSTRLEVEAAKLVLALEETFPQAETQRPPSVDDGGEFFSTKQTTDTNGFSRGTDLGWTEEIEERAEGLASEDNGWETCTTHIATVTNGIISLGTNLVWTEEIGLLTIDAGAPKVFLPALGVAILISLNLILYVVTKRSKHEADSNQKMNDTQ